MLRETIDFEGIRLGLVDTAGIRASDDEVEREGVARARGAASVADLVVLVLDRSRPLEDSDRALLREAAASRRVVVVNKIDLPPAWTAELDGLYRDSGFGIRNARAERAAREAAKREKLCNGGHSRHAWPPARSSSARAYSCVAGSRSGDSESRSPIPSRRAPVGSGDCCR